MAPLLFDPPSTTSPTPTPYTHIQSAFRQRSDLSVQMGDCLTGKENLGWGMEIRSGKELNTGSVECLEGPLQGFWMEKLGLGMQMRMCKGMARLCGAKSLTITPSRLYSKFPKRSATQSAVIAYGQPWKIAHRLLAWSQTPQLHTVTAPFHVPRPVYK